MVNYFISDLDDAESREEVEHKMAEKLRPRLSLPRKNGGEGEGGGQGMRRHWYCLQLTSKL